MAAVSFIKYLRTLGFSATNDIFAKNAWYFRNALVRANYTNLRKEINETTEYLELFLRNLLLNENNELLNRNLHISGLCEAKKADIYIKKPHIESKKADIERKISENAARLSSVRIVQMRKLLEKFGYEEFFGRSDIKELLEIENSAASKLSSILVSNGIVEPVSGHGKGKYKFKKN